MSLSNTEYRGFKIWHEPKPVPTRVWDWSFESANLETGGTGSSLEDCKLQIDEMLDDACPLVDDLDAPIRIYPGNLLQDCDAVAKRPEPEPSHDPFPLAAFISLVLIGCIVAYLYLTH